MCLDPITAMTMASVVTAAAGQGIGAIAQSRQAAYGARVAAQNARLEDDAARDALDRGRTEAQAVQRQTGLTMGAQRAALAANGIDLGYGSAADFLADTARVGQEDAWRVRENATREATGLSRNAANYRAEASAQRSASKGAIVSGVFGVGSTLLGGAQQFKRRQSIRNPYGLTSSDGIY